MTDERTEWLKSRQGGIGGSDIPRIFGLVANTNALDIFHEKTRPFREDEGDSIHLLRGREFEPNAAKWYWEKTGRIGRWERLKAITHPDYPAFLCHTDGTIFSDLERVPTNPEEWENPEAIQETGTLEIKCPMAFVFGRIWESGMRQSEILQAQTYAAVARHPWLSMCYFNMEHNAGPVLTIDLEADRELGDFVLKAGQRFWDEHVVPRIPPDPSEWNLIDREDAPLIREGKGEVVVVESEELGTLARESLEAAKMVKQAEAIVAEKKAGIMTILKTFEAKRLRVPGVAKVTLVENAGRESFNRNALEKHRPVDRDKLIRFLIDNGAITEAGEKVETILAALELDLDRFVRRGDPYSYALITGEKS